MVPVRKSNFSETQRVVQFGFTTVIILVLVFAATYLYQIRENTLKLTNIVEINNIKIEYINHMRDTVRQRQIMLNRMLSLADPFDRDELRMEFYSSAADFRESLSRYQNLPVGNGEQVLIDNLVLQTRIAQPLNRDSVESLIADFHSDEARGLIEKARIAQLSIMQLMDELAELQKEESKQFVIVSSQRYENIFLWSLLAGAIMIFIMLIISRKVIAFVSHKNRELMDKNLKLVEATNVAIEATQSKSVFLATMSHEIRTPLTAIIGFADASRESGISNEERNRLMNIVMQSGKHLLQIINDILDISKIEANRLEFEKLDCSPFEILYEVEEIVSPQAKKKGIAFQLEYNFPLPLKLQTDPLRLKQILLNICSNALKFTEYGRISVTIGCNTENDELYFEVKDTGVGMSAEQTSKVFDAFVQADSSISRKYGGTGLGLSLSKEFAEKLGGTITVNSLHGVGSRFCVTIKAGNLQDAEFIYYQSQLPENVTQSLEASDEIQQVCGNILLVEDNHYNQQLLTILLSKTGANVSIAETGKQAIDRAMLEQFDLILMDVQMPVMGGIEATRLLRKNGYNGPIVALTANAMKQDREECLKAGCNDFLTKPVEKRQLYQVVNRFLQKQDDKHVIVPSSFQSPEINDLVIEFARDLPARLNVINTYFQQQRIEDLSREIHKLKGLGGAMGYPVLTELSKEIEQMIVSNNMLMLGELLQQIDKAGEKIRRGITTYHSVNAQTPH